MRIIIRTLQYDWLFNGRSTDLHTRIAELGVVLHHSKFFFLIFQKTFLEKKIEKKNCSPFLLKLFQFYLKVLPGQILPLYLIC